MDVKRIVWRKSSLSTNNGGDCVEVAQLPGNIGVRDSKAPDAGQLSISRTEFAALVQRIKRDDLDL
jgi:hypothetical protein